jgi:predicted nucleic acid-binding protein
MTVVDASVAVKWLVAEEGEDAAEQLLAGREELAAPFVLRTEVVAAIARKARFKEITIEDAFAAVDLWVSMIRGSDVAFFAEDDDLQLAVKLSLELNHPLQDCIYLALAERLDAPLVTSDGKFAEKARRRYPRGKARVRLLTDAS